MYVAIFFYFFFYFRQFISKATNVHQAAVIEIIAHACLVKSLAVCTHLIVWLLANTHPHTTASLHRLNQSCLACTCSQPVLDAMEPSIENKATM